MTKSIFPGSVFTAAFSLGPLLANACVSIGTTVANAPTVFFKGMTHSNISFGPSPLQKLDIYTPETKNTAPWPVIVFFYGGRWTRGKKEDYKFVATALASRGFLVVVPDYRKYPDIRFPAFVEDGALAVKWVHNTIARYNGRADLLFLSGHSSGAHIASLLVSDGRYLEGGTLAAVKGFAGLAGPYSFTPESDDLKDMFGPPETYPQMQATTFIDGHEPPMLLLHGEADDSVGLFNMERLRDKIEDHNGRVETKTYPNIGHIELVGTFSWFWRNKAPVLADVSAFFTRLAAASDNTWQRTDPR